MSERGHVPIIGSVALVGDRRTHIERAALELFATRGYRATRMTDIGDRLGIRGPSLYKHVGSKHDLLASIMTATMSQLLQLQAAAVASSEDLVLRLRRMAEAHVRFHARHQLEAFVGNREINNLLPAHRDAVLRDRARYESALRDVIEAGVAAGRFNVSSVRLASYAILDMGIGVSLWYRAHGAMSEDAVVYTYGDIALRIVGVAG